MLDFGIVSKVFSNPEKMPPNKRIAIFIAMYLGVFVLAGLSEWVVIEIFAKWNFGLAVALGLTIGYWLLIGTKIFVEGGTWSATVGSAPKAVVVDAQALKARLLEINNLDLPFHIREDNHGNLVAEWKIVDAKWGEILEVAGLNMQHQILMKLDQSTKRVKAVDIDKSISWRAHMGGAGFSLSYFRGISFFQYERGFNAGLIYKDGSWGLKEAYNYRFLLSEMKKPIVDCITHSGWAFCPVMFFAGPLAAK